MRLRFTPRALAELDEVLAYIVERSPKGARRVQTRIRVLSDLLLRHPYAGQRTSLEGVRRITATPHPYLIYYEVTAEEIIVVGVRHAVRDPASMPGGNAI